MKTQAIFFILASSLFLSYSFINNSNPSPFNILAPITYSNYTSSPVELGKVSWLRNINVAISESKKTQKPILILFQEVPGCSTCRNYGSTALSHPLVVEAIESLFVPLAIYNNKGGEDTKVLKYFGEPAWNNPVVRIVESNKKDLIPRLNGNYSEWGLIDAMIRALDNNGEVAPRYLEFLRAEFAAKEIGTKTTTFGMYCFWSGEKEIGSLNGVVETKPGFMSGKEVVQIEYNPSIISFDELSEKARNTNCNSHVFTNNNKEKLAADDILGKGHVSDVETFKLDADVKYYLSKTPYRFVPMTELQATKINSLIGKRKKFQFILSPKQLEFAIFVKENPNKEWKSAINVPFVKAWELSGM